MGHGIGAVIEGNGWRARSRSQIGAVSSREATTQFEASLPVCGGQNGPARSPSYSVAIDTQSMPWEERFNERIGGEVMEHGASTEGDAKVLFVTNKAFRIDYVDEKPS